MTSAVCPPRSRFTATGRSPQFWSPPPGAPVRCLLPLICVTFNTSTMVSCLWVRLLLQARGSGSPHLFLTCSAGGGGPTWSLSLLHLGSFTCFWAGCGACPTSADSVLGVLPLFIVFIHDRFYLLIRFLFILFVFFFIVSLPNGIPLGLCILDT